MKSFEDLTRNIRRLKWDKQKICSDCQEAKIWNTSARCRSCAGKNSAIIRDTEKLRVKMSKIAKKKGFGKWMTGKKLPLQTRKKIGKHFYKGIMVGYEGLHKWVRKNLGKPNICTVCGADKYVEWANKSHTYRRDLSDWLALCKKCHRKYDKPHKGSTRIYFSGQRRILYV